MRYEKLEKIGKGTYGEVFKCRHKKTGKLYALKKIKTEDENNMIARTAWTEIETLLYLDHENVVDLIEYNCCKRSKESRACEFYLMLEFCEQNLDGLLRNNNVKFSLGEIKKVMQQLFNGLYYMQKKKILHLDVKPANILVTKKGVVKLADFSLALKHVPTENGQKNWYTYNVVSLCYRPPELLLGERNYGFSVDMWSAGCIMAEMWTRRPIMPGHSEQHQLKLISKLCGSITTKSWPEVSSLELYKKMALPKGHNRKVQERLEAFVECHHALDLLDQLLTLNPSKRIDCQRVLLHEFFWTDPIPRDFKDMLATHNQSMWSSSAHSHKTAHHQHPIQHLEPSTRTKGQYPEWVSSILRWISQ